MLTRDPRDPRNTDFSPGTSEVDVLRLRNELPAPAPRRRKPYPKSQGPMEISNANKIFRTQGRKVAAEDRLMSTYCRFWNIVCGPDVGPQVGFQPGVQRPSHWKSKSQWKPEIICSAP
eukprot:1127337-Amorphochlora_amoeboformis.AAC.3